MIRYGSMLREAMHADARANGRGGPAHSAGCSEEGAIRPKKRRQAVDSAAAVVLDEGENCHSKASLLIVGVHVSQQGTWPPAHNGWFRWYELNCQNGISLVQRQHMSHV